MGNEMGNNNTTGLKEEENLTVEDPNKGLVSKEITRSVDDVTQENHLVPDLQGKDSHERVEDVSVDKQAPNKEDKDENGDFSLDDSLVIEAGLKEESSERSGNQQASLTNEVEDENLIELNIDDIVRGTSENQLEKQDFPIKKEENEMTNSSHDQEAEKVAQSENDRHESDTLDDDDLSLPDTVGSSGGTERISTLCAVLEDLDVRVDAESIAISEKEIEDSHVEHKNKEAEEEKELSKDDISEVKLSDKGSSIEESLIKDEEILGTEEEVSAQTNVFVEKLEHEQDKNDLVSESETEDSKAVEQNKDCLLEEANESDDHEAIVVISPQLETVPSESKIADCSDDKDDSSEKKTVEEPETLYAIEIDQSDRRHESAPSSETVNEPKKEPESLIAEIIISMNDISFDRTSRDIKASSRESTDSDRDSVQYSRMRKSPSFSVDLQDEARNDESDQTPLLYQDKAEIQSSPPSLGTTLTLLNGHSDHDHQAMPVEEKVVALERSDSEKSKTPFLGTAEKEAKDVVSSSIKVAISSTSSSKGKEKRKVRSSLFGTCLCCATVIN